MERNGPGRLSREWAERDDLKEPEYPSLLVLDAPCSGASSHFCPWLSWQTPTQCHEAPPNAHCITTETIVTKILNPKPYEPNQKTDPNANKQEFGKQEYLPVSPEPSGLIGRKSFKPKFPPFLVNYPTPTHNTHQFASPDTAMNINIE